MNDFSSIKDVIVGIAAFIGAGLGIFNYLRERNKDKVSLRVTPKSMMSCGVNSDGQEAILSSEDRIDAGRLIEYFEIEIVNLSNFPVEINSVGFLLKGTEKRMGIINPTHQTGDKWPKRLEPRESVDVHPLLNDVLNSPKLSEIECAYAETSCGHIERGSSKAFSLLLASVKKIGITRHST